MGDGGVFHRIMLATDGSEGSRAAARLAAGLAAATGAKVVAVHVSNVPPVPGTEGVAAMPDLTEEYIDAAKHHAFGAVRPEFDSAGIKADEVVVIGPPADTIMREAVQRDVDCIVVGHTGMSAVERFFMGSVSDRIAHKARCAVLIAPVPGDPGRHAEGEASSG